MCNDGSWVIAGTLVQKVQFFASFFNSTEQFNEESSKLDDVTSPPVFAGLHFDFIFW